MVRCTPEFAAWCRWSKLQSMDSRQTTHSSVHPLEGDKATHILREVQTGQGKEQQASGFSRATSAETEEKVGHSYLF